MSERQDISTEKMDSLCRAMKASVEMLEGPAVSTFEFPMWHKEREEEVGVKIVAFRCSNPDCDSRVHVQIEIIPAQIVYSWSQERSDNQLFGFDLSEEPES